MLAAELFAEAVARRKGKKPAFVEQMDDFERALYDIFRELKGSNTH